MYREASDAKGEFGKYLFTKNPQDDILKVYKDSGELAVEYLYDAWGAIIDISVTTGYQKIADANCLLYRGYYYDQDTGLYYLNSRYYDASLGRFINPYDVFYLGANSDINSYNLYAYCSNNPVMRADNGGEFWHIVAGAAIGAVIGGVSKIITNAIEGKDDIWDGVAVSALTGALSGALAATGVGLVGQVVGGHVFIGFNVKEFAIRIVEDWEK